MSNLIHRLSLGIKLDLVISYQLSPSNSIKIWKVQLLKVLMTTKIFEIDNLREEGEESD